MVAYQKKLHQLDGRQQELVKDNFELKDLCLYLDEERLRSGGLGDAAAATFPSDTKCPKCGQSWTVSSKSSIEKAPPIPISSHSGEACYDRNASTPSPLVAADPSEVTNESDSRFGNIALEFENTHHFRQVELHAEHKKSSETSSSSNDSNGSAAGEAETSSMETVSSSSLTSKSQSQETQLAMQILSSFHEQSQKQRQEAEGETERSCFDFQTEKAILQEMCLLVQRTFDSDV